MAVPASAHPLLRPGATYRIEVRNQGQETLRDWRLKANAVKAPSRYVSRMRNSVEVGIVELPRIRAGERKVVELTGTAPFVVFLGNGHGVEIRFNGEEISFFSRIRDDNTARLRVGG